jgi:hypothetical protein
VKTHWSLTAARATSILGFLVLVTCTYGLRSEVLQLNRIRFSGEEARAAQELQRYRDSYPDRVAAHELALQQHELQKGHFQQQMEHYERLVELSRTDFDEYVRAAKDGALQLPPLPRLPRMPSPPEPVDARDRLAEIRADFATQRYHYFDMTSRMNWVACAGAVALVGGLLFLLMFDVNGARLFYLIILVLSFIFLIGPSFHTILSGIVGFLEAPR